MSKTSWNSWRGGSNEYLSLPPMLPSDEHGDESHEGLLVPKVYYLPTEGKSLLAKSILEAERNLCSGEEMHADLVEPKRLIHKCTYCFIFEQL